MIGLYRKRCKIYKQLPVAGPSDSGDGAKPINVIIIWFPVLSASSASMTRLMWLEPMCFQYTVTLKIRLPFHESTLLLRDKNKILPRRNTLLQQLNVQNSVIIY